MTRMLVVAGTLGDGVLSTDEPVPTDGQPEWWRCERCGMRELPNTGLIYTEHETPDGSAVCQSDSMVPDGPFPFTVAVWQEDPEPCCFPGFGHDGECAPVGVVVATVEVTGPSLYRLGDDGHFTWHTPTGEVTWLDTPIPMERPWLHANGGECPTARCDICIDPAPSWWADVDIKEHTR